MSRFSYPPGGSGSGHTIEDEGSALTARSNLDFVGRGVIADDFSSETRVRIDDPITTMPVAIEEFIGSSSTSVNIGTHGWNVTGAGASYSVAFAPITGHPGVGRLATGATSGNTATLHMRTAGQDVFDSDDNFDMTWIFRTDKNGGALASTLYRVGLGNNCTSFPPADGMWMEKLTTDTNWFFVTRSASTETRTDSGVAMADLTWYRLRIRRSSGTITFTLDAGSNVDHTTNVTSAAACPFAQISTAENVAKRLEPDYWDLAVTGLTR